VAGHGAWNAFLRTFARKVVGTSSSTSPRAYIRTSAIDPNGNETDSQEFGWLDYASVPHGSNQRLSSYTGTPIRHKVSTYHVIMSNNAETAVDNTTHSYANASGPVLSGVLHSSYTTGSPGGGAAVEYTYDASGNPLYEYHWKSGDLNGFLASPGASNAAVTARTFNHGAVASETDLHGDTTQYTFDGNNLYVTDIYQKDASGVTLRHFQPDRDFSSGLLNSIQDVDNSVTNSYHYDQVGRVTQSTEAGFRTTNYAYDDANRRIVTTSNLGDTANKTLASAVTFDQGERLYLSRQLECNQAAGTSDDSTGIKQMHRYKYSGTSRYEAVSNPYRGSDTSCSTMADSAGWSLTEYDVMNRPVTVTTWDTSALPAPFANNSGKTGQTTSVYDLYPGNCNATTQTYDLSTSGPTTQIKVQTGANTWVSHTNKMDALGNLISVSEDGISATTQYSYDVMGNLIGVQPVGSPQTCAGGGSYFRYFTYDPLGRLTGACNPESGLITYTYDDANNTMTRTQGGVTTTTVSDALHRVKSKTYSDSTPQVTWSYDDGAVPYSKGRLTKVTNSAATRSILAYDALGRVLTVGQTVGTFTAPVISHTWNLAGLSSTTLPTGNTVSYDYDGAGRVSKVSSGGINYASSIEYAAHGAIGSLARGDSVPETTTFNSRLQPVTIQAGSLLKLDHDYGGTANNRAGVNNNGNVLSQTITRGGQQWAQAFGYDSVDRLTCANEVTGLTALACGTGGPAWQQSYSYDAMGNRAVASSFTQNLSIPTPIGAWQYSSANRIVKRPDGATAMPADAYDAAGNLQNHPDMGKFRYDAENRLSCANALRARRRAARQRLAIRQRRRMHMTETDGAWQDDGAGNDGISLRCDGGVGGGISGASRQCGD
jgi:YD repeat-containing protein